MRIKNENVTRNQPHIFWENSVILNTTTLNSQSMRFFGYSPQNDVFFKKNGFTLAEVLITLVIIGVIAALTIPTLMSNMNEKATVTKLKKAFTTLNNATLAAVAENGSIDTWGLTGTNGQKADTFNSYIKPYLKVIKDCGTQEGCWTATDTRYLNGDIWSSHYNSSDDARMELSDGVFINTYLNVPACNYHGSNFENSPLYMMCGSVTVDINGYKGENTVAKDVFSFSVTKYGQLIPAGVPEAKNNDNCTLTGKGSACAAWVIYKENMDYLKGKTVSW